MKRSTTVQRAHNAPLPLPHYEDGAEDTLTYLDHTPENAADDISPEDLDYREEESTEAEPQQPRQPQPRVKTVSVQYGRKLNLGDYNSAEVSITLWADLDEDEDVQGAVDVLYQQAKDNVKKQAMPLLKAEPISLNYRETFLGTPVEAPNRQPREK